MPDIHIPTGRGLLPAYQAGPEGDRPRPGVVVIHDIFGMSPDTRRQADWLAGEGYVAVAPDLFSWGRTFTCFRAAVRALLTGNGRPYEDIEAVRAWLLQQSGCTGRVGVIGFCLGGQFALQLAPGGGYAASSVNYGAVPKDAERLLAGACPVIGSYGGRDRALRSSPERLDRALTANGVDHEITVYPAAGHGFMNDHRPAETTSCRRSSWPGRPAAATTRRPCRTPAAASSSSSTATSPRRMPEAYSSGRCQEPRFLRPR